MLLRTDLKPDIREGVAASQWLPGDTVNFVRQYRPCSEGVPTSFGHCLRMLVGEPAETLAHADASVLRLAQTPALREGIQRQIGAWDQE